MKTAFTVWNDRIAPLFDVAGKIHVVESEAGNITAQTGVCLDDPSPALKVRRLADLGVQMVVCGAISRSARNMLTAYGIELVAYINGDLDTVIDAWQNDQLRTDALRMPGCKSPFQRGFVSNHPATKELKMRNDQVGGRYQNRDGKGRGGQGGGRGGRSRQRGGPGRSNMSMGHCVCAKCGHEEPHQQGIPCMHQQCPNCGETMTRK
ncbi:MAG: NifB/NifX family molybdenum-iron cluster-binding protein [Desulfobacteraceae bacterium]|jgi:predicted Fe-Mo cluster-binding NifX family protein